MTKTWQNGPLYATESEELISATFTVMYISEELVAFCRLVTSCVHVGTHIITSCLPQLFAHNVAFSGLLYTTHMHFLYCEFRLNYYENKKLLR